MKLGSNGYHIQNVPLIELVKEYDSPLYVYDFDRMGEQVKRLSNAFSGVNHKLLYACKALTNINVLSYLKSQGCFLDTVSIQEVWLGLEAGFEPHEITYTPNCVSIQEIQKAVEQGVNINIDNLSILEQFAELYGDSVPVCVRINPHIFAGGNPKISVGHIDSKFGISIHQLRHLTRLVHSTGLHVNGLHMHTGSDILDIDIFLKGADVLLETASNFDKLEYIDFGSGFKVKYKEGDQETDIEALGEGLTKRFKKFCSSYGKELAMYFEPGKYLVSEAGYFLVRTNVVKQTTATVFAGVDSGMNHLIRPMFYDAYHTITNISNPEGRTRYYTVVGYICETDTFGWDRPMSEIREGDILAFHNAGAYAFSMASNYNSRFRPAEVAILNGKHHLIRKREQLQNLLENQVRIEI